LLISAGRRARPHSITEILTAPFNFSPNDAIFVQIAGQGSVTRGYAAATAYDLFFAR
jgi:hypothetical protein